ncbi:MAG: four helix bundle protein [Bacteroidota bacterium]
MASSWEKLIVWQKAHNLVLEVYKLCVKFPDDEKWGLTSQLKRAMISVPANIVEGKSKHTDKELLHSLYISRGSLEESRYYMLLANDLKYITQDEFDRFSDYFSEISYLLNTLIKSIRK